VAGTDDDWDLYADAVIDCEIDGRTHALRGPDAGPLPGRVATVFVLTAYNPGGVARDVARDEADERALERDLVAGGVTNWAASGRSRDASWSEPGVAVAGIDRAGGCALGRRYGQLAVFELTADEVRVVRCADEQVVRTRERRV
jgi:hypothetical protein